MDINGHLHYGLLLFMLAVANLADNLIVDMYSLDTVVSKTQMKFYMGVG